MARSWLKGNKPQGSAIRKRRGPVQIVGRGLVWILINSPGVVPFHRPQVGIVGSGPAIAGLFGRFATPVITWCTKRPSRAA